MKYSVLWKRYYDFRDANSMNTLWSLHTHFLVSFIWKKIHKRYLQQKFGAGHGFPIREYRWQRNKRPINEAIYRDHIFTAAHEDLSKPLKFVYCRISRKSLRKPDVYEAYGHGTR